MGMTMQDSAFAVVNASVAILVALAPLSDWALCGWSTHSIQFKELGLVADKIEEFGSGQVSGNSEKCAHGAGK